MSYKRLFVHVKPRQIVVIQRSFIIIYMYDTFYVSRKPKNIYYNVTNPSQLIIILLILVQINCLII